METDQVFKGSHITRDEHSKLVVPDDPIIGFIEGDGVGRDIWPALKTVVDAAVGRAYGGVRKVFWRELLAGEKAHEATGEWLPVKTLEEIRELLVAIKGPLTTPVGEGIRSLNVSLRQFLDLYACVRPIRYYNGVPSPMKHPERLNVIIFRENTEDVYAGIEWRSGSPEAKKLTQFLEEQFGVKLPEDSGIGIKPISRKGTQRLMRMAIRYALRKGLPSVTMVHKGNIMKYTEGAFRTWGYELAASEFADHTIREDEIPAGTMAVAGEVIIKDRMADSMFQQALLRPEEYQVLVTPNLNGDYLSDALAAQVGGLGMAPGANVGDECALFEATHGSAPKYAGLDKVNPGSLLLSGVMMLEYLGWVEAARMIESALERTIRDKIVTYDLARQMTGAKEVKCSQYAEAIIERLAG